MLVLLMMDTGALRVETDVYQELGCKISLVGFSSGDRFTGIICVDRSGVEELTPMNGHVWARQIRWTL